MSISFQELEALMEGNGTEERIREYVRVAVRFHSFAPPGLLIGVFMVDLALEKLGMEPNEPSSAKEAEGIRVYIDAAKINAYPALNQWYMNDPAFKRVTDGNAVYDEILRGGRNILSWEPVRVLVPRKAQWEAVTCLACGELVPDNLLEDGTCVICAATKYYKNS